MGKGRKRKRKKKKSGSCESHGARCAHLHLHLHLHLDICTHTLIIVRPIRTYVFTPYLATKSVRDIAATTSLCPPPISSGAGVGGDKYLPLHRRACMNPPHLPHRTAAW